MTRNVGSLIRTNGCTYVVVEDESDKWEDSCGKCAMRGEACMALAAVLGECDCTLRSDKKPVHFEHYGVNF